MISSSFPCVSVADVGSFQAVHHLDHVLAHLLGRLGKCHRRPFLLHQHDRLVALVGDLLFLAARAAAPRSRRRGREPIRARGPAAACRRAPAPAFPASCGSGLRAARAFARPLPREAGAGSPPAPSWPAISSSIAFFWSSAAPLRLARSSLIFACRIRSSAAFSRFLAGTSSGHCSLGGIGWRL